MLPAGVRLIERGWLSSNNILIGRTLVDTGYGSESEKTLELVDAALEGAPLEAIVNTHCHADHIGGNAALARRHRSPITIPAGAVDMITAWDERALVLTYADQICERFAHTHSCAPGDMIRIGALDWQVVAAPGHDPHAVMLFSPEERLLIPGDALWEHGFGVIFPALDGSSSAFAETRATLERIATLGARTVIPGHGRAFGSVDAALERAFARLAGYEADPMKLARHGVKVMVTFTLLERGSLPLATLPAYVTRVPILADINARWLKLTPQALAEYIVTDLERSGVAAREDGALVPRLG